MSPQKRKKLQEIYIAATSMDSATKGLNRGLILCGSMKMDAIYLLILVGLYLTTHGLVRAFNRLGKTP